MNEVELLRKFLLKHGKELHKIAKGDILLEAGLKRLEEIAGISHESRCHEGAANPGEQYGIGIRPVSAVSDDPGAPRHCHDGSPGAEGALSSAAKAGAAHPLLPSPPPGRAREASNLSPSYPPGVKPPAPTSFSEEG